MPLRSFYSRDLLQSTVKRHKRNGPLGVGPDEANRALLLKFALAAVIMFAFGYLLVPFYEQICKATGLRDIDAPGYQEPLKLYFETLSKAQEKSEKSGKK